MRVKRTTGALTYSGRADPDALDAGPANRQGGSSMLLFLFALVVAVAGVGIYAHYNTGAHDITLRTYHFAGVPDWMPIAVAAGTVLFLFLVQAIYASVRIRLLRRASRRTTSTIGTGRTAPSTSR